MQLLPTKLLGVVADHGEFPIERIAVDMGGEGRWVGSAGHEEMLKLTDLKEVFEDDDKEGSDEEAQSDDERVGAAADGEDSDEEDEKVAGVEAEVSAEPEGSDDEGEEVQDASGGEEEPVEQPRQRKRKKEQDPLNMAKRKKGKNTVEAEPTFFADL